MIVLLRANLDDFTDQLGSEVCTDARGVKMSNKVLDNLGEVLLCHHSVQQVQGTKAYRLVLILQTVQDQILVRLNTLRVVIEDLVHGQQTQVFY